MLSATKLAHLKLTHLHSASNALFLSSPPVSAYLSSKVSTNASKSNIQLSGSTWKKTCAACGYTLVPGWTCSVRARGIGGDPKVGWTKKSKGRAKHARGIGCARAIPCTGADVEKSRSRSPRKRGKRTRGARGCREKTELKEPSTLQILVTEADESATTNTYAADSATAIPVSKLVDSRKRSRTTSTAGKEPRMVYSCKICSNKTIHSLPKKPAAASHDKATSEVAALQPTSQAAVLSKSSIVSASKPTLTGNSLQSMTAPATATNAAAKKRAKSRKNTLSDMLAKEAANRSAATGSGVGGFGFDLMDFMKTS